MTVDDAAMVEAAFIQKANRDLAAVRRVQQVREQAAGFPGSAADEYPRWRTGGDSNRE